MSAPRAWNLTRSDAVYRHDAFSAGLRVAGFDVPGGAPQAASGNVLLIWNRYGVYHDQASSFERGGGTVLVAENGYLAPGGESPHGMKDRRWYALARGYHNDSSVVRSGDGSRFDALGVELKPWRKHGNHILIAPNRNFGTPGRIMPNDWTSDVRKRLTNLTKREIRVRPHPGNDAPRKPLAEDLAGAWCTVIWNSSAGVHSLIAGVPVIFCAPRWICEGAALRFSGSGVPDDIEEPLTRNDVRLPALHRLANSQFHLSEIESGAAFRWVLGQ